MKITPKKTVKKFQIGGSAPVQEAPAQDMAAEQEMPQGQEPAPEQGQAQQQDPIVILAQMSMQALQNQDCQIAMQVCQAFIQLVQQMQGGAPQEPQGEPVFRKGGILVRRIKK